jgi:hypothetical protein
MFLFYFLYSVVQKYFSFWQCEEGGGDGLGMRTEWGNKN